MEGGAPINGPDYFRRESAAPDLTGLANHTEYGAALEVGRANPGIYGRLDPCG